MWGSFEASFKGSMRVYNRAPLRVPTGLRVPGLGFVRVFLRVP